MLSIESSTFNNNYLTNVSSSREGAAIYGVSGSYIVIDNSSFNNHISAYNGGAIFTLGAIK